KLVFYTGSIKDGKPCEESVPTAQCLEAARQESYSQVKSLRRVYFGKFKFGNKEDVELFLENRTKGEDAIDNVFTGTPAETNSEFDRTIMHLLIPTMINRALRALPSEISSMASETQLHLFTEPDLIWIEDKFYCDLPIHAAVREMTNYISENQASTSGINTQTGGENSAKMCTSQKRMLLGIIVCPHADVARFVKIAEALYLKAFSNYFAGLSEYDTDSRGGKAAISTSEKQTIMEIEVTLSCDLMKEGNYAFIYTEPGCTITGKMTPIPCFLNFNSNVLAFDDVANEIIRELKGSVTEISQIFQHSLNIAD
ncbi:hypothetical protein ENBRE01_3434, partial [Enteropsectra breve]